MTAVDVGRVRESLASGGFGLKLIPQDPGKLYGIVTDGEGNELPNPFVNDLELNKWGPALRLLLPFTGMEIQCEGKPVYGLRVDPTTEKRQ